MVYIKFPTSQKYFEIPYYSSKNNPNKTNQFHYHQAQNEPSGILGIPNFSHRSSTKRSYTLNLLTIVCLNKRF